MADWHGLVRERLSGLALDASEKEEVHAEIAAHLEESYESLRAMGLTDHAARQQALAQVSDWKSLEREVCFAKRGVIFVQKRLQQLWIPGFLTLILSIFSLMAAQTSGFQAPILWRGSTPIVLYVPWLVTLPFFGALGAYVSWRAGGSRAAILLSSVFPSLALALAFLLMFPIGMAVKLVIGNDLDFGWVAALLLKDGISWLLLPGVALLAGGLLAHLLLSAKSSSRKMIIG